MFGSVGAFTNERMYAAVFGDRFGVKLDKAHHAEAASLPGSGPFGPESRPMAGWISLPTDLTDAEIGTWFAKAYAYVASLGPKETRRPRGVRRRAATG